MIEKKEVLMAYPLVLLSHPVPPEWIASLQGRVRLIVGPAQPAGLAPHLLEQLPEAEGLLCLLSDPIGEEIFEAAPRLRVVSNMAVGFDNIDIAAAARRHLPVGNTPNVLTEATADLAFGLLLMAGRGLGKAAQDARDGLWGSWSPTGWLGMDFPGATLGIIGAGKIGRAVAQRAQAFRMKIIYAEREEKRVFTPLEGAERLPLKEVIASADFLSLHCPLTAQTRGLIDEAALRSMKRSAVLVNTARGAMVQTEALLRALRENWIFAAGLDVTDPEPLPPSHPLYDLPNCFITPHIGSATFGARRRMAELACENLLAGLEGRRLPYCVNPQVYEK